MRTDLQGAGSGVVPDVLAAALEEFRRAAPHDGIEKLIILQNGEAICEGAGIDRPQDVWSVTKTFLSTTLGLLYDDGAFALDQPVANVLPELRADYSSATFADFMTMRSGYQAQGDERPVNGYAHGPSRTPFCPAPPRFAPGERYEYWDSAVNMLGLAATRLAGGPLDAFFRRRIGDPLGMTIEWGAWLYQGERVNGGSGNYLGSVQVSARDLARLGELFRNDGLWGGKRLLSSDWCNLATRVQVPGGTPVDGKFRGAGAYGYLWWAQEPTSVGKWPSLGERIFSASGMNNNDLFVVPDHDLTVVRLGLDQDTGREISDATYASLLGAIISTLASIE